MQSTKPSVNRRRDTQTLLRLTADDKAKLRALARTAGLSMNDIIQMLVRERVAEKRVRVLPEDYD